MAVTQFGVCMKTAIMTEVCIEEEAFNSRVKEAHAVFNTEEWTARNNCRVLSLLTILAESQLDGLNDASVGNKLSIC